MQQAIQAILEDAVAGALVAVIGGLGLWFSKTRKSLSYMVEDWRGEDARPGVEARPGVMLRLQNIEKSQAVMDVKVSSIEHEVNFNSGLSIKDAVHRTDRAVTALQSSLDGHLSLNTQQTNAMMDRIIEEHDA